MGLIEFNLLNFAIGIFIGLIFGYALCLFKWGNLIGMYQETTCKQYLDTEIEKFLRSRNLK